MAAPDGIALIDGATAVVLGMLAGSAGRTGAPEILGAGFSKVDSTAGSAVGDTAAGFSCSLAGWGRSWFGLFLGVECGAPRRRLGFTLGIGLRRLRAGKDRRDFVLFDQDVSKIGFDRSEE